MTCECEPAKWERPLAPGGTDVYAVDFEDDLAMFLQRSTSYSTGTFLRSRLVKGYEWEVTTAGQTAIREPRLGTTIAGTTADGSCVLTCRALSTNSLEATVSAVTWEAPTGITVSDDSYTGQLAYATLAIASTFEEGEHEIVVTAIAGTKVIPKSVILQVNRC